MPRPEASPFATRMPTILAAGQISELRLALVGNSDLKARLACDDLFWDQFHSELKRAIADHNNVAKLRALITILKIMVAYFELHSDPTLSYTGLLMCIAVVNELLNGPAADDHNNESLVCDCLEVLLTYANVLNRQLEPLSFVCIWRIMSLSLIAESPTQRLLTTSLKLLPFCLSSGSTKLTALHVPVVRNLLVSRLEVVLNEMSGEKTGKMANDLLTTILVGAAQVLNFADKLSVVGPANNFPDSPSFLEKLQEVLVNESRPLLNIAALNILRFILMGPVVQGSHSEKNVSATFESLFPRIIELIENKFLNQNLPAYLYSPESILSDLCLDQSSFCNLLRNSNLDYRIMNELERLFISTPLFRQMNELKFANRELGSLADLTSLRRVTSDSGNSPGLSQLPLANNLDAISNHLLLFSVFTSSNEDFRRRVTFFNSGDPKQNPNFLSLMIFQLVDDYLFLLGQTINSLQAFRQYQQSQTDDPQFLLWFGLNLGVIITLVEHPIFTSTFYLIRSLCRSVSTLRNFFVNCNSIASVLHPEEDSSESSLSVHHPNIVEFLRSRYDKEMPFNRKGNFINNLLDIMACIKAAEKALSYFSSTRSNAIKQVETRKAFCVKEVVLLASIANFMLDFSSFRDEILSHETFLRDLASLFFGALRVMAGATSGKSPSEHDIFHEQLQIQTGVMKVIKNYIYDESEEDRKDVWDHIPLLAMFEKSLYGTVGPCESEQSIHEMLVEQKVISFEIMRNLTAASSYFSENIRESYLQYAHLNPFGDYEVPLTWNDYLVGNLMSYKLFLDPDSDEDVSVNRFFNDDCFVLRFVLNHSYMRLIVGINFLEDHRYTNSATFRREDFPEEYPLRIWRRFLQLSRLEKYEQELCGNDVAKRVRLANQLSEIKVSVTWIIINLTWKDDGFGFQIPDKVNFHLLDTVRARNTLTLNQFSAANIVIEDSDEEDGSDGQADDAEAHTQSTASPIITPEERARILHKFGFTNVLRDLMHEMATPKEPHSSSRLNGPLERFDHLNANDLYEKSKTAHTQLVSLLGGTPRAARSGRTPGTRFLENHPLRRLSNVISSRDGTRPDVNRGGEGFGYGSDEEYLNTSEQIERGIGVPEGDELTDNEYDFDEPWVR